VSERLRYARVSSNHDVLQGTNIIGKLASSGWGTSDLIVSFNASVTKLVARDVIRSITFKTVGGAAGQRTVLFTVSDGDGGVSAGQSKLVNVS
jgi:hypothetical protein